MYDRTIRHHARILAMQALCQLDVQGGGPPEGDVTLYADAGAGEVAPTTADYARTLIDLAWERRHDFRESIQSSASAWDVERMAVVDRNVICVALAELALGKVPPKVVLNEAVEIAREYASAESAGFVNGVLDELYKSMQQNEPSSRSIGTAMREREKGT